MDCLLELACPRSCNMDMWLKWLHIMELDLGTCVTLLLKYVFLFQLNTNLHCPRLWIQHYFLLMRICLLLHLCLALFIEIHCTTCSESLPQIFQWLSTISSLLAGLLLFQQKCGIAISSTLWKGEKKQFYSAASHTMMCDFLLSLTVEFHILMKINTHLKTHATHTGKLRHCLDVPDYILPAHP